MVLKKKKKKRKRKKKKLKMLLLVVSLTKNHPLLMMMNDLDIYCEFYQCCSFIAKKEITNKIFNFKLISEVIFKSSKLKSLIQQIPEFYKESTSSLNTLTLD